MEERYSDYKIEISKSGDNIPVLNGIYLHSQYDPKKEAMQLIAKYEEKIHSSSEFLVLGLGLGYHIDALISKIESETKPRIIVIEPNKTVIDNFKTHRADLIESIEIIHLEDAKNVYSRLDFIKFLIAKPVIIKHEASFMLHKEMFMKLLTYKADTKSKSYKQFLLNPAGTEIFLQDDLSLVETVNELKKSQRLDAREKYLTLALNEIVKREAKGMTL